MSKLTNEELYMKIKNGDDGLLPELWEQVRKFIAMKARDYIYKFDNPHGCEMDDLIQAGFLAVIAAIKYYKPEAGYKFTTFLGYNLKNAFKSAMGIRSEKRDWLNYAESLDVPVSEGSDMTLLDKIGDLTPRKATIEEEIVENVWNQELRAALDDAMNILSKSQKELLVLNYYYGLTLSEIAEMRGSSEQYISVRRHEALTRIYNSRHRRVLAEFLYYSGFGFNPYTTDTECIALREISTDARFLIQLEK